MFNHRVFLAIDDVSDDLIEQAKTYLGAHYREGSIIMFTVRSIDVLSKCLNIKESDCLEMSEMDETEAKSLFLKEVENSLSENFEINKQYVNACLQKCLFSKGINRGLLVYKNVFSLRESIEDFNIIHWHSRFWAQAAMIYKDIQRN
jgi:hypothetical protein